MKRRTRRQINIEKVAGVLTENQLTRFIINCDEELGPLGRGWFESINTYKFNNEVEVLNECFSWTDSIEGFDYWNDIDDLISRDHE